MSTITPVPTGVPRGTPAWTSPISMLFPHRDAGKSILIMNVHPSVHDFLDRQSPLGPTATEPSPPRVCTIQDRHEQ